MIRTFLSNDQIIANLRIGSFLAEITEKDAVPFASPNSSLENHAMRETRRSMITGIPTDKEECHFIYAQMKWQAARTNSFTNTSRKEK